MKLIQSLKQSFSSDYTMRPFIEQVNGKNFVVLPYTVRSKNILTTEGQNDAPGARRVLTDGSTHNRRLVRVAGAQIVREVQSFPTTTRGLLVLADWLREAGCTQVAMESRRCARHGDVLSGIAGEWKAMFRGPR